MAFWNRNRLESLKEADGSISLAKVRSKNFSAYPEVQLKEAADGTYWWTARVYSYATGEAIEETSNSSSDKKSAVKKATDWLTSVMHKYEKAEVE
jgi:flagellar hook-basal body complex protein FliE